MNIQTSSSCLQGAKATTFHCNFILLDSVIILSFDHKFTHASWKCLKYTAKPNEYVQKSTAVPSIPCPTILSVDHKFTHAF